MSPMQLDKPAHATFTSRRVAPAFLRLARRYFNAIRDERRRVPIIKRGLLVGLSIPVGLAFMPYFVLNRRRLMNFDFSTRFGFCMAMEQTDFIATMIYLFGVWEPDLSAFIRDRLQPGDTFVDVGANLGYFSLLAAQRVGATGSVIAVEASPSIHGKLQRNIVLNPVLAGSISAVNQAVSHESKAIRIYRGPDVLDGWTTTLQSRSFELEAEVTGVTLDDLLPVETRAQLRLIKMDIEGAEYLVLPRLAQFLATCPDTLEFVVELTPLFWPKPRATVEEIIQPLLAHGFVPYRVANDYSLWRYLWPHDTAAPKRIDGPIRVGWKGQVDLLLTRRRL